MYIAFQKYNKKSLIDRIIRFVTKSDFIHCELVSTKNENVFFGYSSYLFEGVKSRWCYYDPTRWEFINLKDVKTSDIKKFFENTKGKGYDYLGILGFVFGNNDNPKRYFCSEWCAKALDIPNPSKISPGWLYNYFKGKV